MKRVKVKSLADCFDYVTDAFEEDTLAIISIQKSSDGGQGFRFIENARCKGALTLLFDDIELPIEGLALFSEEQARQIIDFIEAHREDADTLLVHCYAGQSRSRAVGAFAVKMLGGDNSAYFRTGVPNAWVYETLMKVWSDPESPGEIEGEPTEGSWEAIKLQLEELAYGDQGIVTQLRDGFSGPDEEYNALILEECKKLKALILQQGMVTLDQFNFCVELMYQVMKFAPYCEWVADYGDTLSSALLTD